MDKSLKIFEEDFQRPLVEFEVQDPFGYLFPFPESQEVCCVARDQIALYSESSQDLLWKFEFSETYNRISAQISDNHQFLYIIAQRSESTIKQPLYHFFIIEVNGEEILWEEENEIGFQILDLSAGGQVFYMNFETEFTNVLYFTDQDNIYRNCTEVSAFFN